jgi:acylphosphatase
MRITRTYTVEGKVQGVSYRFYCREKALSLKLSGFVKNLADGSVYIEATGEKEALDALRIWCLVGPEKAIVEDIQTKMLPLKEFSSFTIER